MSSCDVDSIYTHFSDCITNTTKFGKFIYAFFFDDCAVHIEADSFRAPEQFLRLRECWHRAGRWKYTIWDTQTGQQNSRGTNNSVGGHFRLLLFLLLTFQAWGLPKVIVQKPGLCLQFSEAANASIDWNTCVQTFLHQRSPTQINLCTSQSCEAKTSYIKSA